MLIMIMKLCNKLLKKVVLRKSILKKMGKMHQAQVHLALSGIIMDITYRMNSMLHKEM